MGAFFLTLGFQTAQQFGTEESWFLNVSPGLSVRGIPVTTSNLEYEVRLGGNGLQSLLPGRSTGHPQGDQQQWKCLPPPDSSSSQPPPPNNPPHCADCAAHRTMETSGHPPVPCPPAALPLPLSPRVSCHLSMKECQTLCLTGTSCSSGSLRASNGWPAMCNRKDCPPHRLSSRGPPLVSHLPVSILEKIYD